MTPLVGCSPPTSPSAIVLLVNGAESDFNLEATATAAVAAAGAF